MLDDLSDLRETLFAIRLLREQIAATPVLPGASDRLRRAVRAVNSRPPLTSAALAAALREGAGAVGRVDEAFLLRLAPAPGGGRRKSPGAAFQGRAAPLPARLGELVPEMLDTLNAPVAVETWPPVVRAMAAHFLVRIVQPCDGSSAAHGSAVEAAFLAADGIPGDRFLLPEPDHGADVSPARPDPDQFVRARVHRLVERLGDTSDLVRDAVARSELLGWADEREAKLNARQRRLVRWLADGDAERSISFREYVRLHAGRRAPSLRSLQRDWKSLRERGFLGERDGRMTVSADALAYAGR